MHGLVLFMGSMIPLAIIVIIFAIWLFSPQQKGSTVSAADPEQ